MPQPLSLVVTYRPEDVPAGSLMLRLSRSAAGANALRLALGPLDMAATARLVSSMLAGEPVSGQFAAFIHDRTEGVPLAVEESVRLMGDRADLARDGAGWVRRHLEEIAVPPTIRDAVLERAGRLGSAALAVLRAASVVAGPADEPMLRAITGLPAGGVGAAIGAALVSGLLVDDGRGRVSFRHVLASCALYETIPAPERVTMHLRAGHMLEGLSRPPLAELARHFREAGETASWCQYAEQAADLAIASGDEGTAVVLLYDLLANATLPGRDVARLTKKIPFASFTGAARFQDVERALRSALDAGIADPGEEADVRAQLGRMLCWSEEFDAGRAELERAIPHLAHDPVEAARAMVNLGRPFRAEWHASTHLQWLQRAAGLTASFAPALCRAARDCTPHAG